MGSTFISAGCTRKPKVSAVLGDRIVYGSKSNVIVADSERVLSAICMDGDVNAVECGDGAIVVGDVNGRGYVVVCGETHRHDFGACIEAVGAVSKSTALFCTMETTFVYDVEKRVVKQEIENRWVPTCVEVVGNKMFVGSRKGSVFVVDISGGEWWEVEAHDDSIQDIKSVAVDGEVYVATSSQDETVRIWRACEDSPWLEHVQTLNGHSDWVYGVFWTESGDLFSSSGDCSIIHWKRGDGWDAVGRLGGEKAFFSVLVVGDVVVGQSGSGGFYKFGDELESFISGHVGEVRSMDWRGEFLLTASLDMTSRIFYKGLEVGRPQKHGYGVTSARFLDEESLRFVSSGQETILRVYEPTQVFYMSCVYSEDKQEGLCGAIERMGVSGGTGSMHDFFHGVEEMKHAAVPAELSLTNEVRDDFVFECLNEQVLSVAVFNETKKVYGHYFDVVDVAVCGNFVVSCNRSSLKRFSGIFVWTRALEPVKYIEEHEHGIERLVFSYDGRYLAAASRDKTVSIYSVGEDIVGIKRIRDHRRAVWGCSFSRDSRYLATCSRDRSLLVYEMPECRMRHSWRFECEVTSLCFSPKEDLLVVGLECGDVVVMSVSESGLVVERREQEHSKRVSVVSFNQDGSRYGSGGADGMVKVFERHGGLCGAG